MKKENKKRKIWKIFNIPAWSKTTKIIALLNLIVFMIIYPTFLHQSVVVPLFKQITNQGPYFGERALGVPTLEQSKLDAAGAEASDQATEVKVFQKNRIIHVNIMFKDGVKFDQAVDEMKQVNTKINDFRDKTIFEIQYVSNSKNSTGQTNIDYPIFATTPKEKTEIENIQKNNNAI